MNSKIKIIIVVVIIIVVLGWFMNFICAVAGNPITNFIVKNAANKYIDQNYEELNLELINVEYDYKFDYYDVSFQSCVDSDLILSVYVNSSGKVLRDNYDYVAENHNLPAVQNE